VPEIFDNLNFGAQRYGLFATITGVNGRPVATVQAAAQIDGPWHDIPLLYQVNDPSTPLPLCVPHFPRLDWTLWFIPSGETGVWIARFFQGLSVGDPAILRLVDESRFHQIFPTGQPPAVVRVVPKKYEFNNDAAKGIWRVSDDARYKESPVLAVYHRGDRPTRTEPRPWPSVPLLRPLVDTARRPEYFVWGCLGTAEMSRRVVNTMLETDWSDDGD
jgi:hypothetical protein